MAKISKNHIDIVSINTVICNAIADEINKTCGITLTQYRALIRLSMDGEPVPMNRLAKQLFITQSATTAAIGYLAEIGAVCRSRDSRDRREVRVELARHGARLIVQADRVLAELFANLKRKLDSGKTEAIFRRCIEVSLHNDTAWVRNDRAHMNTAVLETLLLIHAQIVRGTKQSGLSVNEYRVLYQLSTSCEQEQPSELSQKLLMRTNEVSIAVKKLVSKDLVKRKDSTIDRRAYSLEVTDRGYTAAQATARFIAQYLYHANPPGSKYLIDKHDYAANLLACLHREQRIFPFDPAGPEALETSAAGPGQMNSRLTG